MKGILWAAFFILLIFILVGIVQANESSEECIFLISTAVFFFSIFMMVTFLLDKYIYEHIVIEDNNLIFKYSKILSGGREKAFQIGQDSKFVWSTERKEMNYMEVDYSQLIFYDIDNKDNIIIDKFIVGRGHNHSWLKFFSILSEVSKLKLEKE